MSKCFTEVELGACKPNNMNRRNYTLAKDILPRHSICYVTMNYPLSMKWKITQL